MFWIIKKLFLKIKFFSRVLPPEFNQLPGGGAKVTKQKAKVTRLEGRVCFSYNFPREGPQKIVFVSLESWGAELSNDTKTIFWGPSL